MQKGALETGQLAFAVEWLQKCGIDSTPLLDALTGNVGAIERLARDLSKHAAEYRVANADRERERASKSTSRTAGELANQSMGLVRGEGRLPPSVVGFLITLLIEACGSAGVAPPQALTQLLRGHLGADSFAAQELKAPEAFDKAACYKFAYPEAGPAEIARHAGVSRPRVSQWNEDGSLDRAVERLQNLNLKGLADLLRSTTPRA